MCRNIKILFNFDPPVTDEEVRAASLQFVRKISGFNKPSKANEGPFMAAIDDDPGVSMLAIIIEAIGVDPDGWMCAKTLRSSRKISACAAIPM